MSLEQFNHKFKRSPIKRAKRRGYLRNVAVVLGNLDDERAIPALIEALAVEVEPMVRGHIAWALGRLGGKAARQALEKAARSETDPAVLSEIRNALHPTESSARSVD